MDTNSPELPSTSTKSENDEKLSLKSMDSDFIELPSSSLTRSINNEQLNSKCKNFDSLVQTSFARISEEYDKSRNEHTYKSSDILQENLINCDQRALSLISSNYQDTSSEEDELDDDDDEEDEDDDKQSIKSLSSTQLTKEDFDVRTKGELSLSDLPPIEDLKISVDEEKCEPVGCIKSIVDTLVVVEAFLHHDALDIDSVLFVDRGQRALGKIFDVFGPVNKPYYAVRFNDSDHIKRFAIQIKEPVYCAPQTEYANYILVSQLLKVKGSDASWKHNNEPPPELLDYSDDEAEKLAKRKRKSNRNNTDRENSPKPPSQNTFQSSSTINTALHSSTTSHNRRSKPANNPHYQNVNNETSRTFPTYAQLLGSGDHTRPRSVNYSHPPYPNLPYSNRPCRPDLFSYNRPPQPNSFYDRCPPEPNSFNYSQPPQPSSYGYSHHSQHNLFDGNQPVPPSSSNYGHQPNSFDYNCLPQPNHNLFGYNQNNNNMNAPNHSFHPPSYPPGYRMAQLPNVNNPVSRPRSPYPNAVPYRGPHVL